MTGTVESRSSWEGDPVGRAYNLHKTRERQSKLECLPVDEKPTPDAERLIHHLMVHEIELEMQNDELRRSQILLGESRERYSDLYDFAPVGYVTLNEKSILLEANLTAAVQLGVERRRLVNTPFVEVVAMEDRDSFLAHLKGIFTNEERGTCEVRLINKNGCEFYALLDSIFIEGMGPGRACRTSISDISRRKHAELALQNAHDTLERRVAQRTSALKRANKALILEMEERRRVERALLVERDRFFTILKSMNDQVYIINEQYDVEFLNFSAERTFGPADGLKCYEHYHATLEPCPWCPSVAVFKGETIEWVWTSSRDGRTYEIWSSPFRNADGTISCLQIMHDITEQRQTVQALRASETEHKRLSQEFRAVLNAIGDTLILLSPSMEIMWAKNGSTCPPDGEGSGAVGRRCHEVLYGLSDPCENCPAVRCFNTGRNESAIIEYGNVLQDRRAFPVKDGEKVESVLMLIRDITETTALQAEAMQAAHLASLGELAAGVAHEINNPITGIINYAQILINECRVDGMETDVAKRIVKEGGRIAAIARSLLAFARIGGKTEAPARIYDILSESIILTQAQIRKEGISLKVEMAGDIPEIDANFQQIQQVFLNVINNARYALNDKYNGRHKNKILEITGKKVIVDNRQYARITIHDKGVGIPETLLPSLGKPFFSTKPFGKGTGLGLSITLKIIRDHGGKVTFDSVDGEYTTVIIDLPARVQNEF